MTSFLVFLAIIAAIVFWAISIYNRLVNERNRVRNAFAQIDVQLTRRYDLIPNLVEAVKGYMKHERETLEAVINARNAAQQSLQAAKADPANAEAIKELGASEGALGADPTPCGIIRIVSVIRRARARSRIERIQKDWVAPQGKGRG